MDMQRLTSIRQYGKSVLENDINFFDLVYLMIDYAMICDSVVDIVCDMACEE